MTQLRFDFTEPDNDDWYKFYCHNCCDDLMDKVKFYREPGLTKMFGWDKRIGYSCAGCGHVYFMSYITIYGVNFIDGFMRTLWKAGWTQAEYSLYRQYTDFLDGGDIYDIPDDKREEFETACREQVAKYQEIARQIKERYG